MRDDEHSTVIDLFGNEVYLTKRKRGRPPFEWTQENSDKINMLLAIGWANERIAGCVLDPRTGKPVSIPTLKRYFRSELAIRNQKRDQLVAKQVMVAAEQAFNGNVGAMRFLQVLIEKNDLVLAEAAFTGKRDKPAAEKLGKKEISTQAAEQADDDLMAELEEEAKGNVRH